MGLCEKTLSEAVLVCQMDKLLGPFEVGDVLYDFGSLAEVFNLTSGQADMAWLTLILVLKNI